MTAQLSGSTYTSGLDHQKSLPRAPAVLDHLLCTAENCMQSPLETRRARKEEGGISRRKVPLAGAAGLRVIQLSARPLLFEGAQYCSFHQAGVLPSLKPQVLLGSSQELESLAKQVNAGQIELTCLDRAIFVVTACRDVPLKECSRLLLWRTFGVPIYEMLLSSDGALIATECDAHEGWHIAESVSFTSADGQLWFQVRRAPPQGTGLTGEIATVLCPCGLAGKRILNASMDYRDPVRHHLAHTA